MTNTPAKNLVAAFLRYKQAADEQGLPPEALAQAAGGAPAGAGQAPELPPEALEQAAGIPAGGAPGAEGAGDPALAGDPAAQGGDPAAAGGDEIDQLLAQLSPEELEQLATELAADMQQQQGGGEVPQDGQIGQLAQSIEGHLGQNPEAELPTEGVDPNDAAAVEQLGAKQAALAFVKTAEYIEGFIEQAVGRGYNVKQAVDMYDSALGTTIANLSNPAVVLPVNEKRASAPQEIDVKTAAYYEGVIERAREYGLSDHEAIQFVKSAGLPIAGSKAAKTMIKATSKTKPKVKAPKDFLGKVDKAVTENPYAAGGIALGAGTLTGAALAAGSRD